ncbi:uncharacterized protein FOMMEDRAFT_139123 [Fomitiporia mediterranea MF3/22]|uniref:uncharacterized protein n=1 Tax=Fomitiporia mediterranea (strain MF3/22) TaxID=694068 RepID=UPI0004408C5E|nr:uncharacterized protein FOMMEDRAFT_139123 [Fomitiporia mediterranea MF3/22]EJD05774.1 hypothetical protein FOMMEDRAFT_139123 [Fomitiporia mediterranea MF3/22]
MAASFTAYASQFLNRQQRPPSSLSTSQPLFYSFTTDDGSRIGDMSDVAEFDDDDDPHLGRNSDYQLRHTDLPHDDDDDPYLRLDDEGSPLVRTARFAADALHPIASENTRTEQTTTPVQGWLSHQAPLSYRVSPSLPSDTSSEPSAPPEDFLVQPTQPVTRSNQENTLTESLLPRDGISRPLDVFFLPDPRPHVRRGRAVHRDHHWTAAWLASVTACLIGSFTILFTTSAPRNPSGGILNPYTTLLHTVPLLTILTFISALVSYAHIMLLTVFVKPVLFATSVFVPATLFISAIWAFVGSFMWEEGKEPSWGETVGLRLFSLVPFVLAILTARRLPRLPEKIHSTSSILTLSTSLLLSNPFLLALSPLMLLLALLGSIPFLTLSFRLLLIRVYPQTSGNSWEWHVKSWAEWSIAGTIAVWLWSWGVTRGVLRTTCASVVGAWYFLPPEAPSPPPLDTLRIHAALYRSTDTSLGSIALSALLLTGVRLLSLLTGLLKRAPIPLLPLLRLPIKFLGNATGALSSLALVYVGLTGDAFFPSARRARALTAAVANSSGRVNYRRSGIDPTLSILTITPLTLTLPFALCAYLFVVHTLSAPGYAPIAALLAGGVTALVGMFCVSLVEDTADTLYLCYCIDRDTGGMNKQEVFNAFEWRQPARGDIHQQQHHAAGQTAQPALAQRSPSPSPSPITSDEDIPLQQSGGLSSQLTPAIVRSPPHSPHRKLDESHESEGSMILGLDFV